jgi:hypothetical protein
VDDVPTGSRCNVDDEIWSALTDVTHTKNRLHIRTTRSSARASRRPTTSAYARTASATTSSAATRTPASSPREPRPLGYRSWSRRTRSGSEVTVDRLRPDAWWFVRSAVTPSARARPVLLRSSSVVETAATSISQTLAAASGLTKSSLGIASSRAGVRSRTG